MKIGKVVEIQMRSHPRGYRYQLLQVSLVSVKTSAIILISILLNHYILHDSDPDIYFGPA